jgi:hypothetical protein
LYVFNHFKPFSNMSLLDTASLIVTPNGYKEGKLYSVIPSDGTGDMSVVRATTATRVNSAGLVELVPYNLFTYSEDYTNSNWIKENATISANSTTAPNGTTTADLITSTSSSFSDILQGTSQASGNTYTLSCYAKKGSSDWIFLRLTFADAAPRVWFNVNTGAIGTIASGLTATIESVGNGWYRCSVTGVASATPPADRIDIALANADASTSPNVGNSAYIWGAQLVEGSTAKDYQKTETRLNIPRLDYSNGTCPSLLVEPQRTNIALYSSSFDNAVYTKSNATITANVTTSPDGYINADKVVEDTANALHRVGQGAIAVTSGVPITFSFFAKAGERTKLEVQRINTSGTVFNLLTNNIIDLTTGVVPAITGATSYGSDSLGNGWFRYYITLTPIASGSGGLNLGLVDGSGNLFYTGDGTSGAFVYGFQAELGSYVSSYIPTTSASVTRNADVISKTGISSLIGQTEGTIFWDIYVDIPSATGHEDIFNIDGGSFGNTIYLFKGSNATFTCEMYVSSSQQATFTKTSVTAGRHKIAFAYANNNTAMFFDGVQVGSTDTSCNVPATSRIQLGNGVFGSSTGFTNAAALWTTRLTNTQLAQLTTI